MRTLILTILLFIQLAGFGQGAADPLETPSVLLEKAVAENAFAGVAAGFSIAGATTWAGGAGYSDLKNRTAFTEQTLTRVASIVKPMTAVALMQLYEQDRIDLDAPIQKYIPDFPVKQQGAVTIRQLLTHTAGVGGYRSGKEMENQKNYPSLADAVAIFKHRNLISTPGEAYHYSTYGYVILGLIIEKVSGMTYEAYMRQNIWEKAGMQNTGVERYGAGYPGKSLLYHKNRKGVIRKADPTNLSDRVPGGGVYSCVADVLKFGDAVLNNTLIKDSTLALMLQDPGIKQKGSGYGFGWTLYGKNRKYGYVFGHTGSQTGASAHLMILPEQKASIVVLSNTSGAMRQVSNTAFLLFDIAAAAQRD